VSIFSDKAPLRFGVNRANPVLKAQPSVKIDKIFVSFLSFEKGKAQPARGELR
jgi:hypothetical protein